jgi:hypothetical protein
VQLGTGQTPIKECFDADSRQQVAHLRHHRTGIPRTRNAGRRNEVADGLSEEGARFGQHVTNGMRNHRFPPGRGADSCWRRAPARRTIQPATGTRRTHAGSTAWTGPRTSDGQPDVHGSYAKDWIGARGPNFDLEAGQDAEEMRRTGRKPEDLSETADGLVRRTAVFPISRGRGSSAPRTANTSSTRRSCGTSTRTRAACPWDSRARASIREWTSSRRQGSSFFEYPYNMRRPHHLSTTDAPPLASPLSCGTAIRAATGTATRWLSKGGTSTSTAGTTPTATSTAPISASRAVHLRAQPGVLRRHEQRPSRVRPAMDGACRVQKNTGPGGRAMGNGPASKAKATTQHIIPRRRLS